jgi:hypothetical protein
MEKVEVSQKYVEKNKSFVRSSVLPKVTNQSIIEES